VLCKTTIALFATNEQQYATRSLLSRQELAGRAGGSTHSLTARLDNWAIDLRSLLPSGCPMGGVATVTVTAARATTSASAASAVGGAGGGVAAPRRRRRRRWRRAGGEGAQREADTPQQQGRTPVHGARHVTRNRTLQVSAGVFARKPVAMVG
jgi:hypothetical protein